MTIRIAVQSPSCATVRITQHWLWALLAYVTGAPGNEEFTAWAGERKRWYRVDRDGVSRRLPWRIESRVEHAVHVWELRQVWRRRVDEHMRKAGVRR